MPMLVEALDGHLTRIMLPETRNLAHSHCPSIAALMGISHKFVGVTSYGRHCGRSKFFFNLWVFSWEFIIFMGGQYVGVSVEQTATLVWLLPGETSDNHAVGYRLVSHVGLRH